MDIEVLDDKGKSSLQILNANDKPLNYAEKAVLDLGVNTLDHVSWGCNIFSPGWDWENDKDLPEVVMIWAKFYPHNLYNTNSVIKTFSQQITDIRDIKHTSDWKNHKFDKYIITANLSKVDEIFGYEQIKNRSIFTVVESEIKRYKTYSGFDKGFRNFKVDIDPAKKTYKYTFELSCKK